MEIDFGDFVAPIVTDHRALPREMPSDQATSPSPDSPVKGPHGNRVPFDRKSGEGIKPFTRFITRPETTVAANTATDISPSERVISPQQPGPTFGKLKSNEELNYRPNRLQNVINDTWTYSPLTWLDKLGRVRFITGLVIICGIIAGVLWKFGTEVKRQQDRAEPLVVEAAPEDHAPRQAAIRRAFESYLAARDIAEKLPKVLDPQRIESRMKDFYGHRAEKDPAVPSFEVSLPVRAAGEWWFKLEFPGPEGRKSTVLMKETPTGGQLDWENFVAYGSMPWARFTAEKPAAPQSLRIQLKQASHFAGKYTDADYLSFEIAHRSGPPTLHGYALRNSRAGQELAKMPASDDWHAMNLYLKWEPDAAAPGSVLVSDVIRNNWLDAVNSAQPESALAAQPQAPPTRGSSVAPGGAGAVFEAKAGVVIPGLQFGANQPETTPPESGQAVTLDPAASSIQSLDAFPSRASKASGPPASAPAAPAPAPAGPEPTPGSGEKKP